MTTTGAPDPTQAAADARLGDAIQRLLIVVAVCAAAGAALGDRGRALEWVAVGLIVAVPIARVGWLAVRWWRQGDRRFVVLALLLLVLVAVGPVTALLQR